MNNYLQHIDEKTDVNNYDSSTRLLFIVLFFFGHILFYYASYVKYKNITYEDDEISTNVFEEPHQEEEVNELDFALPERPQGYEIDVSFNAFNKILFEYDPEYYRYINNIEDDID